MDILASTYYSHRWDDRAADKAEDGKDDLLETKVRMERL